MADTPVIEARKITKRYPNGVIANRDVTLAVLPGEIHALIGENGAGKSTLMKILYGLEQPTSGAVYLRGQPVQINSPQAAIRHGIGMVHQNFMLINSFTVAENVVLNAEPRRGPLIDRAAAIAQTRALAVTYGLAVEPEARIEQIPVGMRQRVEILKALYRGAGIFILDEPTAVLTPGETDELFAAIRNLVAGGKTVIFISHKLREVKAVSDRVTVMRDGVVVGTLATADADEGTLARMMVGRDVITTVEKPPAERGPVVLRVRDLVYGTALQQVSFEVHAGEILGVAGVEGNGQTELVEVLTGLRSPSGGSVTLNDRSLPPGDPRRAREAGIAHIPEDRARNGIALDISIQDNLIVDRYYKPPFSVRGLLSPRQIADHARTLIRRFNILASDDNAPMAALSGGNMQKVIVARELSAAPRLLIAAQPTRGIDIGAIEFIHGQLIEGRSKGLAILLVSADLQEVLKLADRLIVMHKGRIVAHFEDPGAVNEEELGLYMLGARIQGDSHL